ncbi:hypothetical protein M9H77_35742 [Catharanthus roseus]|uniref:Uncharacterized protein n=1 Tax=Catharanthus roseus TaxID=4058 RepID=A0ACB9ZS13_CATRO|nr:hypothetical protein M9H77_35742 [Catharanthus roseus]
MNRKRSWLSFSLGAALLPPIFPIAARPISGFSVRILLLELSFQLLIKGLMERHILEKFKELEELLVLDEIIKGTQRHVYTTSYRSLKRNDPINQDTQRGSYYILGNEKLFVLNSLTQEFLYNLIETFKAFSILLLTYLCIGFHSTHSWELTIGSVYKDFGFVQNDQIISGLVSTYPVILDTVFKYWIFRYLNHVSPLLVITRSIHVLLMIYIITRIAFSNAYPIFAQQGYENPREVTRHIVCANCHSANKPVDIEVPLAILATTILEAITYRPNKKNILVIGLVPYQKYREITFHILSPDPATKKYVHLLKYPTYAGGSRRKGSDLSRREQECQVVDIFLPGLELLVSEGKSMKFYQPLMRMQEIVLQDPLHIQGLLFFVAFFILAQIFLVLKKKLFEKFQIN